MKYWTVMWSFEMNVEAEDADQAVARARDQVRENGAFEIHETMMLVVDQDPLQTVETDEEGEPTDDDHV